MGIHLRSYPGHLTQLINGSLWAFLSNTQITVVKKTPISEIIYAYIAAGN